MGKNKPINRIDVTQATAGGAVIVETASDLAPPARPQVQAPTDLSLTTSLARSAVTPTALIAATWTGPLSVQAERYPVQWSTDSGFADGVTSGMDAVQESATIDNLKVGTLYYVRVAAIYRGVQSAWSDTTTITTATDTTPPDPPSSLVLDMSTNDLIITWTNPSSDNLKDVQIDIYDVSGTTLRKTAYSTTGRFVWSAADNLNTAGTTTKYAAMVKLRARSYNNVYSTIVSDTITKAAPAAPSGVNISGILSTLSVSITGTKPVDVVKYKLRINIDGFDTNFLYTVSQDSVINAEDTGLYTIGVKALDVFDQESSETVSASTSLDFLTIDKLRQGATYSDSEGTFDLSSLKDGVTASGGATYGSSSSWRWVLVERPLIDRYQNITVVATAGIGYIGVSPDNSTWTWYSGTLGVDGRTLTAVANEAAAQTAAVNLPTTSTGRFDLPALKEARFIKLGFKMTSGGTLREFYPRRLIEADDIRAQTLAAITADLGTITAGTVTGATIQTATSGARVVMSGATNGGLIGYGSSDTYDPSAGTGTYQVRWSKADGKLYAGAGNMIIDNESLTIAASTTAGGLKDAVTTTSRVKFTTLADGESGGMWLSAIALGAPVNVYQNNLLIQVEPPTHAGGTATIQLLNGSNSLIVRASSVDAASDVNVTGNLNIAPTGSGTTAKIEVGQGATGNRLAYIDLRGDDTYTDYGLRIIRNNGGANTGSDIIHRGTGALSLVSNEDGTIQFWVNGARRVYVSSTLVQSDVTTNVVVTDAGTTTTVTAINLEHLSSGTPAAGFGTDQIFWAHSSNNTLRQLFLMRAAWATATDASRKARTTFFTYDTTAREAFRIEGSGTAAMIGFLGAAAVARQNITGTRTGTLAQLQTVVANLLTGLASLGLITDSTT